MFIEYDSNLYYCVSFDLYLNRNGVLKNYHQIMIQDTAIFGYTDICVIKI